MKLCINHALIISNRYYGFRMLFSSYISVSPLCLQMTLFW